MTTPRLYPQLTPATLNGRILVAEDEYIIAQDVVEALSCAGAEPLGPVASVAAALRLIASEANQIDAALLDVNLRGKMVWPVVDALLSHGVPVVLTTAYNAGVLPPAYVHLPRCEKPANEYHLVQALAHVLASSKAIRTSNEWAAVEECESGSSRSEGV